MARAFFGPIKSSFSPRHLSRKTWRMRARTLAARPACVRAGICLMRSKRRSDLERQQFGVVALDKCWREWGDALFKPSSLARANSSRRRGASRRGHMASMALGEPVKGHVSRRRSNEIVAHCVAAPPEGSARPRFGRDPADAGRGRARGVGDGLRDGSADAPPHPISTRSSMPWSGPASSSSEIGPERGSTGSKKGLASSHRAIRRYAVGKVLDVCATHDSQTLSLARPAVYESREVDAQSARR